MVVEGGETPVGRAGFDGDEVIVESLSGEPICSEVFLMNFWVVRLGAL